MRTLKLKRSYFLPPLLFFTYTFGLIISFVFVQMCSTNTDFADFRLFWGVGDAILNGKINLVYPGLKDTDFSHTLFSTNVPFLYPPNFASLSRIFALAPMVQTYAVTRMVLFLSVLAAGLFYYLSGLSDQKFEKTKLSLLFLPALLFFPVVESIGIGQLSLLLYLLPIISGTILLLRGNAILAGLCLGVVCLKPQPLVGLFFVFWCLAYYEPELKDKRLKLLLGFFISVAFNAYLALSVFGLDGVFEWLHSLSIWMGSYVYGTLDYFEPYWLLSSVPMIVGRLLKEVSPGAFTPLIPQLLSVFFVLIELTVIYIVGSRSRHSIRVKLELLVGLAILSLPLIAPYMRVYDLSAFLIPFWFLFFGALRCLRHARLISIACLVFIAIIDLHFLLIPQQLIVGFQYGNLFVGSACLFLFFFYCYFCLASLREEQS